MKTRYIWLLPLLLSFVLPGCSDDESPVPDETREERLAAPNFTVLDTELESVSLSDSSSKVVIIDFWPTWCAPCRAELAHFVELYDQ